VFAVFMGYFYGNAREEKSRGRGGASASLSFCALLVPVFCHGTYDTLASISSTMSDLLFFANIIVLVAIAMRLVKKVSAERRQISRW
jgi:RsiW-degrading membrane proteinase PrsW (M82 family)